MGSSFISPRLNDHFDLNFTQDEVDFAIPYLSKDIPLFLDPFLFWNSKNPLFNQLHDILIDFFENIRMLVRADKETDAQTLLLGIMEPNELGLGYSVGSKRGSTIGPKTVENIIALYRDMPQINQHGLAHIEELQFVVPQISVDRICDLTYCILKDFFLKYTSARAEEYKIPVKSFTIPNVWDADNKAWIPNRESFLPYSPLDNSPMILPPLNLLCQLQWINSKDYKDSFFYTYVLSKDKMKEKNIKPLSSAQIMRANRFLYNRVKTYIHLKEKTGALCRPEPLNDQVILEAELKEAMQSERELKKQAALYADALVPPQIALDLEDQHKKITKIEAQIRAVQKKRENRAQAIQQSQEDAILRGWEDILNASEQ
jgi:hypothetical protein